jgi:hypothetical protein
MARQNGKVVKGPPTTLAEAMARIGELEQLQKLEQQE